MAVKFLAQFFFASIFYVEAKSTACIDALSLSFHIHISRVISCGKHFELSTDRRACKFLRCFMNMSRCCLSQSLFFTKRCFRFVELNHWTAWEYCITLLAVYWTIYYAYTHMQKANDRGFSNFKLTPSELMPRWKLKKCTPKWSIKLFGNKNMPRSPFKFVFVIEHTVALRTLCHILFHVYFFGGEELKSKSFAAIRWKCFLHLHNGFIATVSTQIKTNRKTDANFRRKWTPSQLSLNITGFQ